MYICICESIIKDGKRGDRDKEKQQEMGYYITLHPLLMEGGIIRGAFWRWSVPQWWREGAEGKGLPSLSRSGQG